VKFTYLFDSTIRREQIASALLAMAIDGSEAFRRHFLHHALPGDLLNEALSREWDVMVEEGSVDVKLTSRNPDDWTILVENKIQSSAKQAGQLVRYCRIHRKARPDAKLVAVYLAPGGTGQDEVDRVAKCPELQDVVAQHVPWDKLIAYAPAPGDAVAPLVRDALDSIHAAIEAARQEKYHRVGDRETIRDLADEAYERLRERTAVRLRRWSGKAYETIFTARTNVTLWLGVFFEIAQEPPFAPVNMRDAEGKLQLQVQTRFKLAADLRSRSPERRWWKDLVAAKQFEVPGLGKHTLDEKGWFRLDRPVQGFEDDIVAEVADSGEAVLNALERSLSTVGLNLGRSQRNR